MTNLTTFFYVNAFVLSLNIGERNITNIPIIEQKNSTSIVENILMNKAVITRDK